jgi:ribosome-associated protein
MTISAHDALARALSLASESFITASGPGGQNVNKVATAVQLRLDIYALGLPVPVFARFKQEANRADARARLSELIAEAFNLPEKRARTRLNRINKGERLEGKKKRGAVKAGRGKVSLD